MTIQHFTQNAAGRDFVVGDIHGCFDELRTVLGGVSFDESRDRLFSVGDLIDRGTLSSECLSWIEKPWFHPVLGNHEWIAITFTAGGCPAHHYARNGGQWFIDLPRNVQRAISDVFLTLPIVIEVETPSGLVGIVHAEPARNDWQHFCRDIRSGDKWATEVALWSRDRITAGDTQPVSGISRIYVGHTPQNETKVLGNVHYIDTGAVFGRKLTLVNLSEPQT